MIPRISSPILSALFAILALSFGTVAQAAGSYGEMLEQLRTEISAKLPPLDDDARKGIVEAKDAKARVEAVRKLAALDPFLADNQLDAKLAKFFILHDATPAGLAATHPNGLCPAAKNRWQRRAIGIPMTQ